MQHGSPFQDDGGVIEACVPRPRGKRERPRAERERAKASEQASERERECVCVCVCARARVCVRACVCVRVRVRGYIHKCTERGIEACAWRERRQQEKAEQTHHQQTDSLKPCLPQGYPEAPVA